MAFVLTTCPTCRTQRKTISHLDELMTRAKQSNLDRAAAHPGHFRQFGDRMTFHFLEDEQRPILFGDARQQFVEEITLGQGLVYGGFVSGVLRSAFGLFNYVDPP